MTSKRALSIAYWEKRSDGAAFFAFLACIKQRPDLPPICRDIKQLLFKYVKRLFNFHIAPNKKQLSLVEDVYLTIPMCSLQCHRILVGSMGKSIVHIKWTFKVLDTEVADKIRFIENGIIDSLPIEKAQCYRRRLIRNNLLFCNTNAERWLGNFEYVPYTNEYVEAQNRVVAFNSSLKKGDLIHVQHTMHIMGLTRNKNNHVWSMCFSIIH